MNGAPSSTWFSASPDWGWFIVLYFFLGGLAGGCYFLAALIDLFGRSEDRPLARLGYYVAFPCVALSGLLLTADLGKPLRFWHMMIESNTYRPMFKYWSPMSAGVWALLVFGLFSFLSFLGALAEDEPRSPDGGRVRWPALRTIGARWPVLSRLRAPSGVGQVIVVLGAIFGLYIAGYTGVLLAVTNRPIWSDTPLLGMLFIVSAASTSAAMIILLAHRFGWTVPGLANLHRMEDWVITLELLVLIAVMVSLGPVLRAWLNAWGLLLLIVIILGMVAPLVFSWRRRQMRELNMTTSAILVLVAGFLLRVIIVFSAESV
ncbi:MAG TPA: NrfD/PsrC family molybdoenzyme membrane anchor subunit [Vicinamibacterales bacterium]|nr:NrfD/PsrC family molybdoenzyme membrane anchor subunit [Vicinamibacterales bacterium]